MKTSEFLVQHGPTLKSAHLDWLTALKDESMSDVWEGTNDPLCLIEIMRCLLNPNYDTALNEYLRDTLQLFLEHCTHELAVIHLQTAIQIVQKLIDGKLTDDALTALCMELQKQVRITLSVVKDGSVSADWSFTAKEKSALYSAAFACNWLCERNETSALFAAYHATEHLVRSYGTGGDELSDKLRTYVGNPFA